MIIGPRRVVLIGAIAAVVLTIIFYPLLVQTPFELEDVHINLSRVTLASGSEGDQKLDLRVSFNITNTSGYTLTTSKIEYELFADDASVGSDTLSYEDIPVNGRPALFSNSPPITLTDTFLLQYSDARAGLFNKILYNSEDIKWSITGLANIESGTSFQEKHFASEL
ncbi:MAG TPA: hypothetical protein VJZ68_02620 [Nitrososphaera sp.]|nr:hypothetical protein [Nitrososphaera sp.]